MRRIIEQIKVRWEIKSNRQFIIINLVFALTGSSIVFIRRPLFELMGIKESTPFFIKAILYVFTIVPIFYVLLLVVATILGQFKFFWKFEKKVFSRIGGKKKHKSGNQF